MKRWQRTAKHYDWPIEFFETFTPNHYSMLYWKGANTLEEAIDNTHKILEGHLDIGQHDTVFEIGYGRGDFARYLDSQGHKVSGIDASIEHYKYCKERLPNMDLRHGDFYNVQGKYERIFSNEVMVHIKDHLEFFKKCASLQKSGDKMIHKEMHLPYYGAVYPVTCNLLLQPIFNWTGKYHTLQADVDWQREAGYEVEVFPGDIKDYIRTLEEWLILMEQHKDKLIKLVGHIKYEQTVICWKTFIRVWKKGKLIPNITISTKI